jgi:Tfp pilus assembly protein PilF/branched-subunit amino acid transport protein AzlD
VFSFVLALMSKPMVVTLPLIMILLDYWPLKRFESQKKNRILWQLKEKIPFFILSAVLVITTLHNPNNTDVSAKVFPLSSRITNASVAFITYMEETFWPHDLAVFYPFSDKLPLWQVLGSAILIIIISIALIVKRKRFPYLFVGWLWYAVTIAPVIGIIQVGGFAMADRYHYLPSVGIAVGLAWGIPSLIKSQYIRKKILVPLGVLFIAMLSLLTWEQCGYWKNSFTLLGHALRVTKSNTLAHGNLASALLERGNIREAIYHYNKAISITPYYDVAYYNLGIAYYSIGEKQRALEYFKEALRITPDYAAAYYNMGIIYMDLGRYKNAIENYSEAIRISPGYAYAYNDRALAYLNLGNNEQGCPNAQEACALGVCKVWDWAKSRGLCH